LLTMLKINMLFSATLSQRVLELAYEHMNSPTKVEIKAETVSARNIEQKVYFPANNEKIPLLIGLIKKENPFRSIVFVNTKRNAEQIEAYMRTNNIQAAMISGDVRQNKRERLLKQFEEGKYAVLIATDVAARGLHIPDVSHVFNFDLPQVEEDYVHRIGRTARAGASGHSISFACEDTAFYLPYIEAYIGVTIPVESIDAELLAELNRPKFIKSRRSNNQRRGGPNKGKGGNHRTSGNRNKNQNSNKRRNNRRRRKPSDKKT